MLKIGQATTIREAVQIFLQAGFDLLQQPTFFFKYLFARQALFLAQGVGFQVEKYSQLGIEFSANNTVHFNSKSLAHPEELNALRELMNSAFGIEQFSAFPLAHGDFIRGVVLIAGSSSSENMKFLSPLLSVLNLRYENLLLQGRLHDLETFDEVTQVWNRDNFDRRLQEEMARSRRTQLPISLARISVDRFGEIKRNSGQERTDLLLRAIASIIKKNSRINDIVGRLGEDELGLLLPHTRDRGAAIKAERLRRMIESADFSKILPDKTEVTISLGVSEYPSHCRDSEELYQSSDEALFQIKRDGFNQVCLSATPPHFVPDFDVPEK